MTSYIFLDTLRFFAHHGVGEQETVVGNEFNPSACACKLISGVRQKRTT